MNKRKEVQEKKMRYIASIGGYAWLEEADDTYNDFNRAMIEAFKEDFGSAILGRINFCGEQHKAVISGERSVFEEYTGQKIYNFACDFVIPEKDDVLEGYIRNWNAGVYPKGVSLVELISERIKKLGGIQFLWT